MKRFCEVCNKEFEADIRNVNRGWGLCCSKSCAAVYREIEKHSRSKEEKRLRIATSAMNGILANNQVNSPEFIAEKAFKIADAMIKEEGRKYE